MSVPDPVPVLITKDFFEELAQMYVGGSVTIDYGQPNEQGLYVPQVTWVEGDEPAPPEVGRP